MALLSVVIACPEKINAVAADDAHNAIFLGKTRDTHLTAIANII